MSQFSPALIYTLAFEDSLGIYAETVDNKGRVIAGINSLAWPDDFAVIEAVPQDQRAPAVAKFYQSRFWTPMMAGGISSQDLANRYFDFGVNTGSGTSARTLQRAVNALKPATVDEDGRIGPLTLEAANCCDPDAILAVFREQRSAYYKEIVAKNPANAPYLAGWLRRAQN